MRNNRRAGHDFERILVNRFKKLGFTDCVSSRSQNRRLDDAKIDLAFTSPFAIQAKYTKVAPNMHDLLDQMQEACNTLPEVEGCIPVVYHKRVNRGETVTLKAADFEKLCCSDIAPKTVDPLGFIT